MAQSYALLLALDKTDLLQFGIQGDCFVVTAAKSAHDLAHAKINEHTPVLVHPAVACGQAHAVQHKRVQHLCRHRKRLVGGTEKDFRDAEESVLFGFQAVIIIQSDRF